MPSVSTRGWVELALSCTLLYAAAARILALGPGAKQGGVASEEGVAQFDLGKQVVFRLNGLDATGAPVSYVDPRRSKGYAVFVVRARAAKAELAYWNTVAVALNHAAAAIQLIGFCEGPGCKSVRRIGHSFPLTTYAEQSTMNQAAILAREGAAVLIDPNGHVLADFRWRSLAPADAALRFLGSAHVH